MSKLQSALEKLGINTDHYDDHSTKGIINVAQAELNDHLRLYSAVHEHLRECNMYPINIKEMLKMFEEVTGCPGVTQFDTEEDTMSGGSFNYEYHHFEETYSGHMEDLEMNQLIIDLAKVLHDLEWYTSGDTCEDTYKQSVMEFKKQWFQGSTKVRSVVAEKLRDLAMEIEVTEEYNDNL